MVPLAPHSRRAFLTAIGTAPYWTARPATAAEITTAGIGSPPTLPGGLSAFVAAYCSGGTLSRRQPRRDPGHRDRHRRAEPVRQRCPLTLSATAPLPGRPELDTVVWLSVLTLPGTADSDAFFAETEAFLRTTMSSYAVVRPEWSKGWAHIPAGPYTDATALASTIPARFGPAWTSAKSTLAALDPARIYASPLLDRLI
ncbi:MAG TPA: cholesterol oxidase substrate-binding domain-containing protein [Tetrasphaera sp.]|uniref:cholesterol oxidase substrate-binding domain-containing protein n=1 Tax=Nostocoides sp. TaxID=1917966 RepID=UPI002B826801|nr:cholesterol oxidase substrate-binding domain-containing protein [Tetrasphaera sp.]HNQ06381.1 cholesterol oxidase substrate-binding domain-containing protein [Tetrasphaera sp.]